MKRQKVTVERKQAGLRLDLFLVEALEGLSRKKAKRLVDGHCVCVDGRIEPMASRLLAVGETVVVTLAEDRPEPKQPLLSILYEDDECLAVAKPPRLPSGPTRDAVRLHAARLAEELLGRPLVLLHRLDKDTSGVLLLAKAEGFATCLLRAFRNRRVSKTYLALVRGRPADAFGVTCHLREGEGGRMRVVRSGGVRAETAFRTLAATRGYALVEARPVTGRTHQIRVQLAQSGHPLLGDSLYGGHAEVATRRGAVPVPRQMLHALALEFDHPSAGERRRIEAPPPDDFRQLAEFLLGNCLGSLPNSPRGAVGGPGGAEPVRRRRASAPRREGIGLPPFGS